MPKHAAHEMFNLILSPLCLVCGVMLGFSELYLIFMIAGYVFATFYLSPDLRSALAFIVCGSPDISITCYNQFHAPAASRDRRGISNRTNI